MTPKTPAPVGLSRRHAIEKTPAARSTRKDREPAIVGVCHLLAVLTVAAGALGGFMAYGAVGIGLGLLFGIISSLGLWGLATVVVLLWKIERRLDERE